MWQLRRSGAVAGGRVLDGGGTKIGARKEGIEGRRRVSSPATAKGRSGLSNLSLNVPMCIGYRQSLRCGDEGGGGGAAVGDGGGGVRRGSNSSSGNLFNIRNLFTRKVY